MVRGRRTGVRISRYAALSAAVCALALGGCGTTGSGPSSSGSPSTAGAPVPPSATSSTPKLPTSLTTPPPAKDRGTPISATGTVAVSDVEKPCRVMTIAGQAYELQGDGVAALRDGDTVTVAGYTDDTLSTTCQVGVVLRVLTLSTPSH